MAQRNVNSAAKESSESSLSTAQILDLFNWIIDAPDSCSADDFSPTADCQELTAFDDHGPDFYVIWLRDSKPVAAGAPLDGLFRIFPAEGA
ncbi:hypothetical protein [Enterobacter sp.]|uniref:hypothetical protein n=1 Tax=Enterobacter sp. TaxID=42895 RepID=UPI00296FA037|nr:hypothetical protein [Enterobacter sp.]